MNDKIIVLEERSDSGWITCIIDNRWVQAKVYDEPSTYGVNNCRVSKLSIGKTAERKEFQDFFEQMAYHYDRGLDFNELYNQSILENVLETLNDLPILPLDK